MKRSKDSSMSLNPEFAYRKRRCRERSKVSKNKKRHLQSLQSKIINVEEHPVWSKLPIRNKQEIVMSWSINGGTVYGKRYTKFELAKLIALNQTQIEKLISSCERSFAQMYETKSNTKNVISRLMSKLTYQMDDDRARAIQLTEILDEEILAVRKDILDARNSVATDASQQRLKEGKISKLTYLFKALCQQKIESLRVLQEYQDSRIRYLSLFSPNGKRGQQGDDSLDEPGVPLQSSSGEVITLEKALELIDENSKPVLPRQDFNDTQDGPRNPNEGFEDFEKSEDLEWEED